MEKIAVQSSNVAAVQYYEDQAILEVEFLNGSTYQYFDVPLHVYEGLVSAGSVGGFLAANVKGAYRYSRV